MVIEMNAAVQSVRVLFDLLRTKKYLTNDNELIAAVSEVNTDLMKAQSETIALQKELLTRTSRERELEEKIRKLEDWETKAERYILTDLAPGVPAYCVKPDMEYGEPLHYLCANCFARKQKSFLRFSQGSISDFYYCYPCKEEIRLDSSRPKPTEPEIEDWRNG